VLLEERLKIMFEFMFQYILMAKCTGIKGALKILSYLSMWRFCIDSLWTA